MNNHISKWLALGKPAHLQALALERIREMWFKLNPHDRPSEKEVKLNHDCLEVLRQAGKFYRPN